MKYPSFDRLLAVRCIVAGINGCGIETLFCYVLTSTTDFDTVGKTMVKPIEEVVHGFCKAHFLEFWVLPGTVAADTLRKPWEFDVLIWCDKIDVNL